MARNLISLIGFSILFAASSFSQSITMVHRGASYGSLDGVPFPLTEFKLVCKGDVGDRVPIWTGTGFSIVHSSVTAEIAGVGTVTLVTPTRTFVNYQTNILGFGRASGSDLIHGYYPLSTLTWNMLGPVGTLTGIMDTYFWNAGTQPVETSGGVLRIGYWGVQGEFNAYWDVGTPYCSGLPNSTSQTGALDATGSGLASMNELTLQASQLPPQSSVVFLASPTQGLSMSPGGSAGNLCLGASIGRFVGPGQVQTSDIMGTASLSLDLTAIPTPGGLVPVQKGETWNFQAWHRDTVVGISTSNFTLGLTVTFR